MRLARIVMWSALIGTITPLAASAQAASGPRCGDGTRGEPGYTACWFHGGVAATAKPVAHRASPAPSVAPRREPSSSRKPSKLAKPSKPHGKASAKSKATKTTKTTKVSKTSKASRVPKGATALCKDGSYTDNKKPKKGCKKHEGVARTFK